MDNNYFSNGQDQHDNATDPVEAPFSYIEPETRSMQFGPGPGRPPGPGPGPGRPPGPGPGPGRPPGPGPGPGRPPGPGPGPGRPPGPGPGRPPGPGPGPGRPPGPGPGPGRPPGPGPGPGRPPGPGPGPGRPPGPGPIPPQPLAPPPNFIPDIPGGTNGPEAFRSGGQVGSRNLRFCLNRNTFMWLINGNSFWFYPTFIGPNHVEGFRWVRNFWVYERINLRLIFFFLCF